MAEEMSTTDVANEISTLLQTQQNDTNLKPRAKAIGRRVEIEYNHLRGMSTISHEEAVAYLAKLRAGFMGRHYEE